VSGSGRFGDSLCAALSVIPDVSETRCGVPFARWVVPDVSETCCLCRFRYWFLAFRRIVVLSSWGSNSTGLNNFFFYLTLEDTLGSFETSVTTNPAIQRHITKERNAQQLCCSEPQSSQHSTQRSDGVIHFTDFTCQFRQHNITAKKTSFTKSTLRYSKGKGSPVYATKPYKGSGDKFPLILNFGIRWNESSHSRPGRFTLPEEPRYPLHMSLGRTHSLYRRFMEISCRGR